MIHNETANFIGTESWEMKSYHQQGVISSVLASPLQVFLTSESVNVVEGLFHPKYPIAGIQFHPEREQEIPICVKRLIKAFLKKELHWSSFQ